jgi:hypothetical protein
MFPIRSHTLQQAKAFALADGFTDIDLKKFHREQISMSFSATAGRRLFSLSRRFRITFFIRGNINRRRFIETDSTPPEMPEMLYSEPERRGPAVSGA